MSKPTEQDKELNKLIWLIRIHQNPHYRCEYRQDGLKRASVKCRGCCHSGESVKRAEQNIIDFVSSLTADRKRVALEARIDENRACQGIVGSVWSTSGMLNGMEKRTLEFRQELENL